MKSRLQKMALVTAEDELQEITVKSCDSCVHHHEFLNEDYLGDCDLIQRTTMKNDVCGMYKHEKEKSE